MKNLFFGFIIVVMTMPAMAETVFYIENNYGGVVEFTDNVCVDYPKLYEVINYNDEDRILNGCYTIDMEKMEAVVVYKEIAEEGTYSYPLGILTPTEYYLEKYGK